MDKALLIIEEDMEEFRQLFRQRQVEIAMREVATQIKGIRKKAVEKVFSSEMGKLDPEAREVLDKVLSYIEKKYIAIPMTVAKKAFVSKKK
jgi:glutamyl-tRNA reductase